MTITLQDRGLTSHWQYTWVFCITAAVKYSDQLSLFAARAYSSAVEHRIADPAVAGSIPAAPYHSFCPPQRTCAGIFLNPFEAACKNSRAKSLWPNWTRRLTTNQKIGGSSPSRDKFLFI